jgi:hypothetical protein
MSFPFGSGLRLYSAGSPVHQAESSSSSYGLVSHLRLLSTPPHGDAVTFGFRPESVCLKRICTSLNECAHGRTERRRPAGSNQRVGDGSSSGENLGEASEGRAERFTLSAAASRDGWLEPAGRRRSQWRSNRPSYPMLKLGPVTE